MIGCVIAMDKEADLLLSSMEIKKTQHMCGKTTYFGNAFGHDIVLVYSKEGKVNAAAGTCVALQAGADRILNFGVAGGLQKNTEVGKLYLIERAVQYDFDLHQLSGKEVGTLPDEAENFLPLFCPALPYERRALGTGDRFNDSPADHELLLRLGCDIREMEGGAIAQVCKYANVPFTSMKAISDVYGSGSTTEQFRVNCALALSNLKSELKTILDALE